MQSFMGRDFLLSTPSAEKLYYGYAQDMPIVDYHCQPACMGRGSLHRHGCIFPVPVYVRCSWSL